MIKIETRMRDFGAPYEITGISELPFMINSNSGAVLFVITKHRNTFQGKDGKRWYDTVYRYWCGFPGDMIATKPLAKAMKGKPNIDSVTIIQPTII